MSLLGFLEAGGEAVIRGILSGPSRDRAFDGVRLTAWGERFLAHQLKLKGYDRFGYTPAELRDVGRRVAVSMGLADRLNRTGVVSVDPAGIPVAPGASPTGPITVGVVVTYRTPTGTADVVLDIAVPGNVVNAGYVVGEAIDAAEKHLRPGSPPPYRPTDPGSIVSVVPVTVYRGAPMGT